MFILDIFEGLFWAGVLFFLVFFFVVFYLFFFRVFVFVGGFVFVCIDFYLLCFLLLGNIFFMIFLDIIEWFSIENCWFCLSLVSGS